MMPDVIALVVFLAAAAIAGFAGGYLLGTHVYVMAPKDVRGRLRRMETMQAIMDKRRGES